MQNRKYTKQLVAVIAAFLLLSVVPMYLHSHIWTDDGERAHPETELSWDGTQGFGDLLGFVYGSISAVAHYEWPMATGLHSAYINNYSGGLPNWPN